MTDRLGYTIKQMDDIKGNVMDLDQGRVNRSDLYRATKKYFKNYH